VTRENVERTVAGSNLHVRDTFVVFSLKGITGRKSVSIISNRVSRVTTTNLATCHKSTFV